MKEKRNPGSTVDARAKFNALVASGALRACERHVAGAHDAEDRIAEGIGGTWAWYQKQLSLGSEPDLALIRHCCRMRTVDRSHRLDCGDGGHWPQDVYQMQGRNGVELRRLEFVEHEDDRVEEDGTLGLAEAGCADPTDKMNSGVDLEAWLKQLSADDRRLLSMKQAGYGLVEIGKKLCLTTATTWKYGQQLGHELAERAGISIERKRRPRLPKGLPPAVRDAIAVE